MQHLLSSARVDDQRMTGTAADWAAGHLCAGQYPGDVVLIVDETGDAKTTGDCAGAARQYSGTLGGIAMCQVAVTLSYAAPARHALIGRALYLPEGWAADEERRETAGVPDDVMFATSPVCSPVTARSADVRCRGLWKCRSILAGSLPCRRRPGRVPITDAHGRRSRSGGPPAAC